MAPKSLPTALAVAFLTLALAGCGSLLPKAETPPNLYRLSPKSTFPPDLPDVGWQLVVDTPVAPAAVATPRIVLLRNPTQVEYYARANWTDRAPQMVQTLVVESFENSGRITSVGRQSVGLRSDFVLLLELREFQAEYFDGPLPQAHVQINAKLVEMPERLIVANGGFEAHAPSASDSMLDIVAAFDEALGKVMKDMVAWTLLEGEQHIGREAD